MEDLLELWFIWFICKAIREVGGNKREEEEWIIIEEAEKGGS